MSSKKKVTLNKKTKDNILTLKNARANYTSGLSRIKLGNSSKGASFAS